MSKTTDSTTETDTDDPVGYLRAAVRVIGADITAAEASKPGSPKRRAVPRLAQQLVAVVDAARKAEKAKLSAAADLNATLVLAWAKQQSREVRARLLRDLTAIDNPSKRSVLA